MMYNPTGYEIVTYSCTGYDLDGQPVYQNKQGEGTTPEALIEQGATVPLGNTVVLKEQHDVCVYCGTDNGLHGVRRRGYECCSCGSA